MKKYLLFLALAGFFCNCERTTTELTIERFETATYFGECMGTCYESFVFEEGVFAWEQRSYINGTIQSTCQGGQEEDIWAEWQNLIDFLVMENLEEVIGCPDCADGGATYIELTQNGESKRVTFETGNPPPALELLHERMNAAMEEIRDLPACQ